MNGQALACTRQSPQDDAKPTQPVAHTPQTPADDRALRLLEHSSLEPAHKQAALATVQAAQNIAAESGDELQAEFGKEHVALIVGCNQFVRVFRGGSQPGAVELLLDPEPKASLRQAGFALRDPEGQVFKLFGWVRVDPTDGPAEALGHAVRDAFTKAKANAKK